MAVEARRGCGYRKVGGIYMMGGQLSAPCCKLPFPLTTCPCCGEGIKQSRGWTWINPFKLLGDRAGLLWIGKAFYPTAESFRAEAATHGISRRISQIPRDLVIGETWVLFAHPEAVMDVKEKVMRPGIFCMFKPTHLEKIVKQSDVDAADRVAMKLKLDAEGHEAAVLFEGDEQAYAQRIADAKRGIKWVPVPDDDPDHQGSVYDRSRQGDLYPEARKSSAAGDEVA